MNFLFESVEVLNNLSLNYTEIFLYFPGNFSVSGAENLTKTSLPQKVELVYILFGADFICIFKKCPLPELTSKLWMKKAPRRR